VRGRRNFRTVRLIMAVFDLSQVPKKQTLYVGDETLGLEGLAFEPREACTFQLRGGVDGCWL
jgi:hypothetical protein